MNAEFEPRIIAFLCNWCSYAGSDLAGTSRLACPPNVNIIRVMCTGRVNPLFIVNAFQQGADGVLVSGCHPGDCHYTEGNYHTRRRFALLRELLEFSGIDSRRVHMSWVSASEGAKWQETIAGVVEKVKAVGPFDQFQRNKVNW